MTHMKNDIINIYSHLVGSLFAFTYKAFPSENKLVLGLLNHYISLRQSLPRMACGKHYGNHDGSPMKPWRATQSAYAEC
jgi:hypothetical protein